MMGAAAFSSPAGAAECPPPPYSRLVAPLDEVPSIASAYAAKRIAEAQSIFRGHMVSIEQRRIADRAGISIVSFQVSEWLKGKGGAFARVTHQGPDCADKCEDHISERFTHKPVDAVYIVDALPQDTIVPASLRQSLDGEGTPCGTIPGLQEAKEALPDQSDPGYEEAVFRNALRAGIEALKKKR